MFLNFSYELLTEVNQSVGYETVKEADTNPGYESLPEPDSLTPGYERIREPVNYEKIKYSSKEEESEPNYEELKPQPSNELFHCYATINKNRTRCDENVSEPDYASLTRHGDLEDSIYERINKKSTADAGEGRSINDDNNNNNNNNNNHHSVELAKTGAQDHSIFPENLSDLYSKVNKNVKR